MRIGVVTTSYPRAPGEAAGGFVAELSQWIAEGGHKVEVVAAGERGDHEHSDHWQPWPLTRVLAAPGLFYQGGAPDALQSKRRQWQALAFQARMIDEIRKRAKGWDGMVAHWLAPSAIACALATKNKPIWAIAHGGDVHTLARLKLTGATARLLNRPQVHLNFVSRSVQGVFVRNAGNAGKDLIQRSTVASMGIHPERLRSMALPSPCEQTPLVVFVGRLIHLKGVDILLDAMVGLDRECELIIAGAGPMEAALRQRARDLGLALTWAGEVRASERDALLARARVVVLPSRSDDGRTEGMPLVALEALASGSQLIASGSGGLGEIPRNLCHPIPTDDPAALRQSLRRVLDGARAASDPDGWLASRTWDALGPVLLPGLNQAQNPLRTA